jgi:uncharacterized membrane protein YedE/YeeE
MTIVHFTPIPALLGGVLIGLAASLFLLTTGRIAGVAGMASGLVARAGSDKLTRLSFVLGLAAAGVAARLVAPDAIGDAPAGRAPWLVAIAGLLVGYGTRLGTGCTSGHGICGLSRFSLRSLVATCTFLGVAMLVSGVVDASLAGGRP